MAPETICLGLLLVFAAANAVISLLVMNAVSKRGFATNFLLLRLLIFRYLGQYRTATMAETGKTGPLFYLWIISINLMALSAVARLIAMS
jgi:hypothetical protein